MNQRIAELAEQAAEAVIHYEPDAVMITESLDRKIEVPDTFITEFALLIIGECAGIAAGSDQPSKDIKEYFGIDSNK